MIKNCIQCQKLFKTANWNKKKKFCSHKCYWEFSKGKKNPKHSERMKIRYKKGLISLAFIEGGFKKGHKPENPFKKGHIPWSKGKVNVCSEETRRKMSIAQKGKHNSPATEFKKGHKPKNPFKKGHKTWNKGKSHLALEKHYNWQGGISFEEYPNEFNKKLKKFIRERDGYICVLCKRTEQREKEEFGTVLSIDHINGDKKNCLLENLRTLCKRCNSSEMQKRRKSIK